MVRAALGVIVLASGFSTAGFAQNPAPAQNPAATVVQNPVINDIKGKIFDAKMAQQTFAGGLTHCKELDGTTFYFQPRDRVLKLDDYHRSLDSLALQGVFNPDTKRPWNQEDANARWEQVRKQAVSDQANCALVASLPDLQKKLDALQQQAASPNNNHN